MVLIKSKRGFLFTIATIILIIPLIYLVSFYSGVSETKMEDTIGRIRCDELHYFVEDVRRDMERAATIFGRRAAVNAIEDVIQTGVPLKNYTFQCTPQCDVDCGKFIYPENGSEAAIAELVICGTLHGKNVTNMLNNTLPEWIERITEEGELMGFDVNITPFEIKVVPRDAWHFAIIVENNVRVSDREGLCFYTESIMTAISNTSIIGLEDPLHLLENKERKYILNCEDPVLPRTMAGCGVNGSGVGGGFVVLYRTDIGGNMADYRAYCNGSSPDAPPTGDLQKQVFVLNDAIGALCAPGSGMSECFNASMPRHFGAIISYKDLTAGQMANCQITIPWIMGTGDLDDDGNPYGGDPDPECFNGSFIESGDCIMVLSVEACDMYYVFFGYYSTDINTSCYYVSDIEEYYNQECPSVNLSNGPCFFDRLDGNLNLSEKYVKQANETFGTTSIGIESFVDIYTLYNMKNLGYDVVVNSTYSWVDYLYWQNVTGCDVVGYCEADNYSFNLDCPHAHKYNLDTSCDMVTSCPICPNGKCEVGENYVNCPEDCGDECPAGCPGAVALTDCKKDPSANKYKVEYTLTVFNCTGDLMDLSADPEINVTSGGSSNIYTMNRVGLGNYTYTTGLLSKNDPINGSVLIQEPGCLVLSNTSSYARLNDMPDC
ncbi:MAG TPA: hypothetical protein ENG12_02955 [Candidatus Altiarchaeales archaeon]|nr:hypothetical protein [Candidatus Altiarchaeales archaeon]